MNSRRDSSSDDLRIRPALLENAMLRCFQTAAEHGSIRRAADILNVSPSAVSRQISSLEQALQVSLFERIPRGVKLTPAGNVLLHHATQSLRELRLAQEAIYEIQNGKRAKHLSVALAASVYRDLLPSIMKAFWSRFPDIQLSFQVVGSYEVSRQLAENESHIGIAFNLPEVRGAISASKTDLPVGAIMASSHPLAGARQLFLNDLTDYPLFVSDTSLTLYSAIAKRLIHPLSPFNVRVITNSIELMISLVKADTGILLKSCMGVQDEVDSGQLSFVPLSPGELPDQTLEMLVGSEAPDSPELHEFVRLFGSFMETMADRYGAPMRTEPAGYGLVPTP